MPTIELLDPIGHAPEQRRGLIHPLEGLEGKRLGLRIQWASFDKFCNRLEKDLSAQHHVGQFVRFMPQGRVAKLGRETAQELKRFATEVDAAVVGLAA